MTSEHDALIDQLVQDRGEEKARRSPAARVMGPQAILDERGIFGAEFSGLFSMYELRPLPMDGAREEEKDRLAQTMERQIAGLDPDFVLNWYLDRGIAGNPEDLVVVPEVAADENAENADLESREVMRALQEERRRELRSGRELHNRFLAALEYHGNFAFGGAEIHWTEAISAGVSSIFEKDPIKREEYRLQFKSLWPGSDSAVKNLLEHRMIDDMDRLQRQGRRLFEVLESELRPDLVTQFGTDATTSGLGWRQLDPIEGARALYSIGDPHPRRRRNFHLRDEDWGHLADVLTAPTIDFKSVYGRKTADGHVYKVGQFAMGGVPQKIYSIRLLPARVKSGLLDFLTQMPHALRLKISYRNMGAKERETEIKQLTKAMAEAQMSLKDLTSEGPSANPKATTVTGEVVTSEASRQNSEIEVLRGRDADGRSLGWMTILIALSGHPTVDDRGREVSATDDLEAACDALERKLEALGIVWSEEIDHQDLAFLMMFPGKQSLDRLERLRVHSDVFAAVAPVRESFQPQPPITEMEPSAPYLLTASRCGRHDLNSLISGKTCAVLVLGETGGGKSFWTNAAAIGHYMAADNVGLDIVEAGGSLAAATDAAGGEVVYLGDPEQDPSTLPNPFDRGDLPAGGYSELDLMELQRLVLVCRGKEEDTPEERTAIRETLVRLGEQTVMDGSGVRSMQSFINQLTYQGPDGVKVAQELEDFREGGPYGWVFPAVRSRAGARMVDYVFPVDTKDARAELLHLFYVIQQVNRRVDGKHPHKFVLDEANRFLKIDHPEPRRRATAILLSRMLTDAATQWRKLQGGYTLITQSPNHLKGWDPGLVKDLRDFIGTLVVLPLKVEKDRPADEEERGLDVFLPDGEADPVKAAVRTLDRTKYEFVWVQQGRVQVKRIDECWLGKGLFESGATAQEIKRWIQAHYPGTKLNKAQAFERALREVRGRRMTWALVGEQLRGGTW